VGDIGLRNTVTSGFSVDAVDAAGVSWDAVDAAGVSWVEDAAERENTSAKRMPMK
jgi:hypothetical protein